jgi:hypothetical protein
MAIASQSHSITSALTLRGRPLRCPSRSAGQPTWRYLASHPKTVLSGTRGTLATNAITYPAITASTARFRLS